MSDKNIYLEDLNIERLKKELQKETKESIIEDIGDVLFKLIEIYKDLQNDKEIYIKRAAEYGYKTDKIIAKYANNKIKKWFEYTEEE